jgi:hypothetical protein
MLQKQIQTLHNIWHKTSSELVKSSQNNNNNNNNNKNHNKKHDYMDLTRQYLHPLSRARSTDNTTTSPAVMSTIKHRESHGLATHTFCNLGTKHQIHLHYQNQCANILLWMSCCTIYYRHLSVQYLPSCIKYNF